MLGARLSYVGRLEEALITTEEPTYLLRSLAAQGSIMYQWDLAKSLSNYSDHLAALGRSQEALSATEEVIGLWRALKQNQHNLSYIDLNLVQDLHKLSNRFSALGRPQEAISAAQEAMDMGWSIATYQPEGLNLGLASTLTNQANRQSKLGNY